jgi:hypothetical protein
VNSRAFRRFDIAPFLQSSGDQKRRHQQPEIVPTIWQLQFSSESAAKLYGTLKP